MAGSGPAMFAVRVVAKSQWYKFGALARSRRGDILRLDEGVDRTCGGILKIRETSVFITLVPDQIWWGAAIPWPRPTDGFDLVRIIRGSLGAVPCSVSPNPGA